MRLCPSAMWQFSQVPLVRYTSSSLMQMALQLRLVEFVISMHIWKLLSINTLSHLGRFPHKNKKPKTCCLDFIWGFYKSFSCNEQIHVTGTPNSHSPYMLDNEDFHVLHFTHFLDNFNISALASVELVISDNYKNFHFKTFKSCFLIYSMIAQSVKWVVRGWQPQLNSQPGQESYSTISWLPLRPTNSYF
jgi:hypothetical protein